MVKKQGGYILIKFKLEFFVIKIAVKFLLSCYSFMTTVIVVFPILKTF